MCLLLRRQKLCWRERKIIRAHYMLAYECGLRRLRSGRVAHRLSDYNRHIACDQCLSGFIYNYKSSAVVFDYLKKCFLYFYFVFCIFVSKLNYWFVVFDYTKYTKKTKKCRNIWSIQKKVVPLQPFCALYVRTTCKHFYKSPLLGSGFAAKWYMLNN